MKIYHKTFSELLKNSKFNNAYSKVITKKSEASKTVMEEQYQFTITNGIANVAESANETFYTLLIEREIDDPNSFENLIIKSDSLNQTSAFIIKYSYSNPDVVNESFNIGDPTITKEITPIVYNATESTSVNSRFTTVNCYTITFWVCTYAGHTPDGECTHGHYETINACEETIEVGGGGGDDSGSGGGGGGTGGDGDNNEDIDLNDGHGDLSTVPVLPEEEIDTDNPCDKIKSGTNSVDFKTKFKELNTQENYNKTYETGYGLVGSNYVDGIAHPTRNSLFIPENSKNLTHIHNKIIKINPITNIAYDAGIKMLSVSDLKVLIRDAQPLNTNPQDAFVVMASDEGIFAISILESIPWNNVLENKLKEFMIFYLNGSEYIIENYPTMNALQRKSYLEKMFLKGLSEFGLENKIGLFEGVVENENDSNIENYNIKWARKTLKKVFLGYNVEEAPCAD